MAYADSSGFDFGGNSAAGGMKPVTACLVTALVVGVIYAVVCGMKTSLNQRRSYARSYRRPPGKVGRVKGSGKGSGQGPKFANPKGMYGKGGPGQSGFETYHYKPNARDNNRLPRPAGSMSSAASAKADALWVGANQAARAAAQPQTSAYSQLEAPVVSSLDPQSMEQNPLDPYLENITYHLTTYKNRNNNFDPRGQPALDPSFLSAQNQLVNPRNMERLAYHGPNHQIEGCASAANPRY